MYRTCKQSPERNGHADRHCPPRAKRAGAQLAFMVAAAAACTVGLASSARAQFKSWHAAFVGDEKGRKDAEAMKQRFFEWTWEFEGQLKGWETQYFPAEKIGEALAWLEARSVAGEITLAYYAGEGHWDTDPRFKQEESQTEDPGGGTVDETNEGVAAGPNNYWDDQFGDQFREWNKEGYGIAIFDCCSAGGMVDGRKDINGKDAQGENKKQETVLMACTEHEFAVKRNERGVFTEFLLKHVPGQNTVAPTVDAFRTLMSAAAGEYQAAYTANPGLFNNQLQHFKQAQYTDGDRQVTCFPEPTSLLLLAGGLLLARRRVG